MKMLKSGEINNHLAPILRHEPGHHPSGGVSLMTTYWPEAIFPYVPAPGRKDEEMRGDGWVETVLSASSSSVSICLINESPTGKIDVGIRREPEVQQEVSNNQNQIS